MQVSISSKSVSDLALLPQNANAEQYSAGHVILTDLEVILL